MSKKIYISPSNQNFNVYATGNTNEKAQCHKIAKACVDYLKKAGAKKLSIGVNRFNIPAQKLYKSVGFTEDCVYDEGIWMTQLLSEE